MIIMLLHLSAGLRHQDSKNFTMKFDDVLKHIGEFGPYQRRVFFLTAIPSLLAAFEAVSVIFTFNIPDHRSGH